MTKDEFWQKWNPCDHPPIQPSAEQKAEFMNDLDLIIEACALHVEKMIDQHPHWTDDEHDGILLAASALRELKGSA